MQTYLPTHVVSLFTFRRASGLSRLAILSSADSFNESALLRPFRVLHRQARFSPYIFFFANSTALESDVA